MPRNRLPILAVVLGALIGAPVFATPALAGDIILFKDGKVQGNKDAQIPPGPGDYSSSRFEVTEENVDKTVYKIEGVPTPQSMDTAKVREVFHDPASTPRELTQGVNALQQGKFAEGRDMLGSVVKGGRIAKWAKDKAAYEICRSYWYEGDVQGTIKACAAFKANHGTSRLIAEATTLGAKALLASGKVAEASKEYTSLKSIRGLAEEEKLKADYWIAWIAEQQGSADPARPDKAKLKSALEGYRGLALKTRSNPSLADLAALCEIGVASCQIAMGDHETAKAKLEKLAAATDDPVTLAGAHTMIGNALMRANIEAHDKAVYEKALLHYLRVVTLYGDADGAEDYMAESLFHSGELFAELRPASAKTDEDKEAVNKSRARARREWDECVQRFPTSSWARRAQQAKAQLR